MKARLAALAWLVACAAPASASVPDAALTAAKLRTYCAACHALGQLRFIYSDDDDDVWRYIFREKVPGKPDLWAKRILELIDWPSDHAPPAHESWWMPKGVKRQQLANDCTNGVRTRRRMVDALRAALP